MMRSSVWIAFSLLIALGGPALAAEEGLVGHWRFDTGPGPVQDLSGKGHTATLTGGEVVVDGGRKVLRCDGKQRIEVPAAPGLSMRGPFSIEARIKPTDLADGRIIAVKADEYLFRIDWPKERSNLSFFLHSSDGWEPRAEAYKLAADRWYHVAAVWDGTTAYLWVNGQPFHTTRKIAPPAATASPLLIASASGFGAGFVGCIDYARVYERALSAAEVLRAAFGIGDQPAGPGARETEFDFRKGLQGWAGREGVAVSASDAGMVVKSEARGGLALRGGLAAPVGRRDFLSLRMAADKGSRAEVIFVTTKGAGRIVFPIHDDGEMHTYVQEPWQWPGWGGDLLALGLVPSEAEGATARVDYLRLTEKVKAEPELQVLSLLTESALPRAGRTERLVARVRNAGGPASRVKVALALPKGISLKGPVEKTLPALGYQEERELVWQVRASAAAPARLSVKATTAGAPDASRASQIAFLPEARLPRASYVPEPRPAKTGKYRIWTHYCPLWKHGTHRGWSAIEPYPERKPVLGWYNEGAPEVADWHIKYWLEHGISGVVYCWYRTNLNAPATQSLEHAVHDGLLKAKYLKMIDWAIMWENGCGKGAGSVEDLMENVFPFWLDNYFTHPSYLKVDGKPVLYVWVPRNVTRDLGGSDNVRRAFELMRAKCRERGLAGLYIVGCVGSAQKETLETMAAEGWDASSAYGNNWSPAGEVRTIGGAACAPFENFVEQQERTWKAKREYNLLPDITAAMMGWDPRPWHMSFYWSQNTVEKFRDLCLRAKRVMDSSTAPGPQKNTAIFCCWNEFGEGHYIEPTRGYGFSYLDIIRDVFTDAPKEHVDLAPEDVGLGPYDSWYQEARPSILGGAPSTATSWAGDGLRAWGGMMGIESLSVKEGVLRAVSNSTDPALHVSGLRVRAGGYSKVVVEMRVNRPDTAQLFWSSTTYPRATEAGSVHAEVVADGEFHPVVFNVGANELWGGCLTGFRLDPANAPGITIEIRSVRME